MPALVLAGVLPCITLVAIATQDPMSALIVLVTLPLIPVFGILVGLATADRARSQWRALASLSGHFLDVMRGLPTLVAFRRAEAQSATIGSITDRYRRRTLRTLQIAFASSAVLELVATLSVALVAVTVGLRLANGDLDLQTALVVLLLAPEAYWPLRRVGAEFHAAAEGVATLEAASELADVTDEPAGPVPGAGAIAVDAAHRAPPRAPASRRSTSSPARSPSAGSRPSPGRPAPGSRPCWRCSPASSSPPRERSASVGTGSAGPAGDSQVAWLPQRPVFVAGTVADNLRLAAPAAADDDLWPALARVALEERVRDLPAGLDTPLGEDGATLSAGERARLALARVVLSDRPWVLLDEPTAHLDR